MDTWTIINFVLCVGGILLMAYGCHEDKKTSENYDALGYALLGAFLIFLSGLSLVAQWTVNLL